MVVFSGDKGDTRKQDKTYVFFHCELNNMGEIAGIVLSMEASACRT
jgi:hypothetical protein